MHHASIWEKNTPDRGNCKYKARVSGACHPVYLKNSRETGSIRAWGMEEGGAGDRVINNED